MATYSLKKFCPVTTLSASNTTLYTASSPATSSVIKQMLVANYSASSATVSVYLVPSGGSASNSNVILPSVAVAANSTITLDVTQVMNQNDFIVASASAGTAINITISGYEVQ